MVKYLPWAAGKCQEVERDLETKAANFDLLWDLALIERGQGCGPESVDVFVNMTVLGEVFDDIKIPFLFVIYCIKIKVYQVDTEQENILSK